MKYITISLLLSSVTLASASDTFLGEVADGTISLTDSHDGKVS